MASQPASRKHTVRNIFIAIGLILVAALGAGYYWLTWTGDTGPIVAEANRFKAPSDWKLVNEQIVPPQHMCMEKLGCPGISRAWNVPQAMTCSEVSDIFNQSGIKLTPRNSVSPDAKGICSFDTSLSHSWEIYHTSRDDNDSLYEVIIYVR